MFIKSAQCKIVMGLLASVAWTGVAQAQTQVDYACADGTKAFGGSTVVPSFFYTIQKNNTPIVTTGFQEPGFGFASIRPDAPESTQGDIGEGAVLINCAPIKTSGRDALGIYAFTMGGKGGDGTDGGFWHQGGYGRPGGYGGDLSIYTSRNSSILTEGVGAHGILAWSLGGHGGGGGTADVASGGPGGRGGTGGSIIIENQGQITTLGYGANGMFARSQGGVAGDGSAGGSFGHTGDGGPGGSGGNLVIVGNTGTITTSGTYANAIRAESIGGHGATAATANSHYIALGGDGGVGGSGGEISSSNHGTLITTGNNAKGITAQSIGGGGGVGGDANDVGAFAGVAVGGSGGGGGHGGRVGFDNRGDIRTSGSSSHGIMANSIGGGGGDGGSATGITLGVGASVQVSLGGSGGDGGDGGTVNIQAASNITTGVALDTPPTVGIGGSPGDFSGGILAQSIGGGGGIGGRAVSLSASAGDTATTSVSVGLGGSGGKGGAGGDVTIQVGGTFGSNTITTGRFSDGLTSQSIGGGGGNGGNVVSAAAAVSETAVAVKAGIGGTGGLGGDGGRANLNNFGTVSTFSDLANGLVVRSIGGGGGSGGNVIDVAASLGKYSGSINVGIGGSGGSGSKGGVASLTNSGTVTTLSHLSHGLVAQSIGGGGGSGGNVHTYAIAASFGGGSKGLAATTGVSIGGIGGSGGGSSTATIVNSSNVTTYGDLSQGVVVQAIGGGGGAGGNVLAVSVAASLDKPSTDSKPIGSRNLSASVTVGGSAGNGGVAGNASFVGNSNSSITTNGTYANGVMAQSIGGGGGSGGHAHSFAVATSVPVDQQRWINQQQGIAKDLLSKIGKGDLIAKPGSDTQSGLTATVSVGGTGGSGNLGGQVDVQLASSSIINTNDTHSHGVFAQSIGGGGGSGGYAFADGFVGIDSFGITMTIGGIGGTGGNAGIVNVAMNNATPDGLSSGITTQGDVSHGIVAQSIGGGGGSGGQATSKFTPVKIVSDYAKKTISIGLGGSGGASGDGNNVNVNYIAPITTYGQHASAILAQSVGGGGGIGAGSSAASGKVAFTLGGSGGSSGNGGTVTVGGLGNLFTNGNASHGVIAQSIGGGGGYAGTPETGSLTVTMGGNGGGGGNGGDVNVSRSGNITTNGATAIGILAQSVGGGGGLATATSINVKGPVVIPLNVTLNGNSGNGGNVNVDSAGQFLNLTTNGAGAHGVLAQSVGGGGGIIISKDVDASGFNQLASGPSPTDRSFAGNVSTAINGNITTKGQNAYGIYAQVLNSGLTLITEQGAKQYNIQSEIFKGTGIGTVRVDQAGSITTQGENSHGIVAINSNPKLPLDPNQAPAIGINIAGSVTVSGDNAWGIQATNGYVGAPNTNSLLGTRINIGAGASVNATGTSAGAISSLDYLTQTVIAVNGTINAGKGIAAQSVGIMNFNVGAGGDVIGDISLGQGGGVSNYGNINGSISNATTGPTLYNLHAGAQHFLAVDPTGKAGGTDVIKASTLNMLGGTIRPYLTSLPTGSYSKDGFITGVSSINTQPFSLTNTLSTVFDYRLVSNGRFLSHDVNFTGVSVDFRRAGLGGNDGKLAELATSLLGSWTADINTTGNQPLNTLLLGFANATDPGVLSKGLEDFDTATHFSTGGVVALTQGNDLGNMQSCGTAAGSFAAIKESECNWAKVGHGVNELRDGDQKHSATSISLGRQMEVSPDVFVGLSAGYEDSEYESVTATGKGDRYYLGGIAKLSRGPILASAATSLSYGQSQGKRIVAATGDTARSDHEVTSLATRLRAGYLIETGALQLTPLVELDLALIKDGGYEETGAGVFNLKVHSKNHFVADLKPALRFGTDMNIGRAVFRGYAEGGAKFALNELSHRVSLADAPLEHDSVSLAMGRDRVLGTLATGLAIHAGERFEINGRYEAGFGKDTRSHAGSFKLGYKF